MKRLLPNIGVLLLFVSSSYAQNIYEIKSGKVTFKSNAPLENIQANSNSLIGLMDVSANTFAFTIDIMSFKGFNSALQQEHFYENYMETDLYPKAVFTGKLIDKFNPQSATQKLRAKGSLTIHGVKNERIIDVVLTKTGEQFSISSHFNVDLKDHAIRIPKVVYQKIAENIRIEVKGDMAFKK
jgi:polyisoprenoid-binding protein YceI